MTKRSRRNSHDAQDVSTKKAQGISWKINFYWPIGHFHRSVNKAVLSMRLTNDALVGGNLTLPRKCSPSSTVTYRSRHGYEYPWVAVETVVDAWDGGPPHQN